MDDKYVQSIRYKLQKRVRRVNSADTTQFHVTLKHFFLFIDSMPLLAAVRDDLLAKTSHVRIIEAVDRICGAEPESPDTEEQAAAIGYVLLRRFCDASDQVDLVTIGLRFGRASNIAEAFEFARTTFLEPFYEFLDEHIDEQQAILFFLRKYKSRCEWFRSEALRGAVENNTQKGEKLLAADLYEFLHEQGISFHIEPRSASGIVDLVAEQVGEDRVIADAKIFWPEKSKGKPYIRTAYHQAYTYARDYNESCAYLVIYKFCPEDLNFVVPTIGAMFPCAVHNGKHIFFIVIDLCAHGVSASKRGGLRAFDISLDDLIQTEPNDTTPTSSD